MCTIDRKNESESRGAPLFNDKASLLTAVYHMLKDGTFHQDLGADYLVKRDKARIAARTRQAYKGPWLRCELHRYRLSPWHRRFGVRVSG